MHGGGVHVDDGGGFGRVGVFEFGEVGGAFLRNGGG